MTLSIRVHRARLTDLLETSFDCVIVIVIVRESRTFYVEEMRTDVLSHVAERTELMSVTISSCCR